MDVASGMLMSGCGNSEDYFVWWQVKFSVWSE